MNEASKIRSEHGVEFVVDLFDDFEGFVELLAESQVNFVGLVRGGDQFVVKKGFHFQVDAPAQFDEVNESGDVVFDERDFFLDDLESFPEVEVFVLESVELGGGYFDSGEVGGSGLGKSYSSYWILVKREWFSCLRVLTWLTQPAISRWSLSLSTCRVFVMSLNSSTSFFNLYISLLILLIYDPDDCLPYHNYYCNCSICNISP